MFDKNHAIHCHHELRNVERFDNCHSFDWRLCMTIPPALVTAKEACFITFRFLRLFAVRPVVASIRAQVRGTSDTMSLVFKYLLSGLEW